MRLWFRSRVWRGVREGEGAGSSVLGVAQTFEDYNGWREFQPENFWIWSRVRFDPRADVACVFAPCVCEGVQSLFLVCEGVYCDLHLRWFYCFRFVVCPLLLVSICVVLPHFVRPLSFPLHLSTSEEWRKISVGTELGFHQSPLT